MKLRQIARRSALAATASALLLSATACGNDASEAGDVAGIPDGQLQFVIPYPAGGPTDVLGRLFADQLSEKLDRPVVVQNVDGGGGTLGIGQIVQAKADGLTFGVAPNTGMLVQPLVNDDLPWGGSEDFTPFGTLIDIPVVLVVSEKSKWDDMASFVDAASSDPGGIDLATTGDFTLADLAGKQIEESTGIDLNLVPYASAAESITGILGGKVDATITSYGSVAGQVDSGDIRVLALLNDAPLPAQPDLPLATDQGFDKTVASRMYIVGPQGLPQGVTTAFEELVDEIFGDPNFKSAIEEQGGLAGQPGLDTTKQAIDEEKATMEDLLGSIN